MKPLWLALAILCATASAAAKPRRVVHYPLERSREIALERTLCADKALSCSYVRSLFENPNFALYTPPPPTPPSIHEGQPERRERNPYLRERFGLLTPASLERCRNFIAANRLAFNAAQTIYGVPPEIICGHLRIETNFGLVTPLTPHPFGTAPAFNRLVTLYVRRSSWRRREFAVHQLKLLIAAAKDNGWNLFEIPGSVTGAIGLLQFEPTNFYLAVDGDGDGTINLFSPSDAILSLAHYLVVHGWDRNPVHQEHAIYSYYGRDPHKYYMKAVLAYAAAERVYLGQHPITEPLSFLRVPEGQ